MQNEFKIKNLSLRIRERVGERSARTSQELRSLAEPTATGSEALEVPFSLRPYMVSGGMSETSPRRGLRALPECPEQLLPGSGDLPARHGGQGLETAPGRLPGGRCHSASEVFQATSEVKTH